MPKHRYRTWTFPWYGGTRTARLALEEQVVTVETHLEGSTMAPFELTLDFLLRSGSVGDPATDSDVLLAMARGKALGLTGDSNDRWRFWNAFDPTKLPVLEVLSPAPDEQPRRVFTAPEGLRSHTVGQTEPVYVSRWDGVFLHGPERGGLPISFRRELRAALRASLAPGARALRMFPVVDYDRLPSTKWSAGNTVTGSNARFDSGWLRWEGWDFSGRPEGGSGLYSPERVFAGLHPHVPIPSEELLAIEREVTLRE